MVTPPRVLVRQTLSASRKRESSPPEAILFSGPAGAPGLVATVKVTASRPSGPGRGLADPGLEHRALHLERRQLRRTAASSRPASTRAALQRVRSAS